MSIKILLLTHEQIGKSMLNVAKNILGDLPTEITTISVLPDCQPDKILDQLNNEFINYSNEKVLILSDIFGATPCNIAQKLNQGTNVCLVTGLNLPMLVRVLNYIHLPIEEVCEKAIAGGQTGIFMCCSDNNNED